MTGPAFERVLDALRAAGRPVKLDGPNRARSSCPAHDGDNKTALSIVNTADRVNLHCFTRECDGADILAAIGLSVRDRYHEPKGNALARYDYGGGYWVERLLGDGTGKQFRQASGWAGKPRPLYRRERITPGRPVFLVEGEEDVHAVEAAAPDAVAVSAPQGAANFAHVDVEPLRGAVVVAVVDRDAPGDTWAATVRDRLDGVALTVRFVHAHAGKDAADHLAAGLGVDDFDDYQWPRVDPATGEVLDDEPPGPAEPPEPPAGDRPTAADLYARLVADRVRALRVERDARAVLAREGRDTSPFDAGTLGEVLARPAEPEARVAGLVPWQASALVVAQRKAGKTTLTLNLARCLITGEPFLGSLAVRPIAPDARIGFLNYEVSAAQLARWADEVGVPVDRLFLVNVRGRRNPLTDAEDRARLAELLRAARVEVLIVDPFGRAFGGVSQNDAAEVGAWLVNLDTFARAEVGARDLFLTAHAGWNGERTRGSSALEDWADVIITLNRDEDSGDRFIRATGRDIELDEDRLRFDPLTRTLSLTGTGSRKDAAEDRQDAETAETILALLRANPGGLSGEQLNAASRRKDAAFRRVRDALVCDPDSPVTACQRQGRGGGTVYRLIDTEPPEPPENPPNRDVLNPPNPPLLPGGSDTGSLEANPPSPSASLTCADCGVPIPSGYVRCAPCRRVTFGGAR